MTALMAIFSTVARPKFGGTYATRSAPERPAPAIMAATRSRVGGTTGSPSVTPRSKSASNGSTAGSLTATSGLAHAEVGVVAFGHGLGVVGIREDGDPGRLGRVGLLEELLVVLEDVHALFRPRGLGLGAAPHDENLGEPAARGEARAHRHHRAPDVLEGLHRPRRVREHGIHGHGAVVGPGLALVRALGKRDGPPRPREPGVLLGVPLVLLGRLDADALGQRMEEPQAVHLLDRVDLASSVLAGLPVGRELADLAL